MRALIIGYGSIGRRHARLLQADGHDVALVSQQTITTHTTFSDLETALAKHAPDHVVIANATASHGASLTALQRAHFSGCVLVEKPLFASISDYQSPYDFSVHVAYHLRFHPIIQQLKYTLQEHAAHTAHVYVGQHLAQWRPDRHSHNTYSAHKAQGGGVLRDLSHELDLLTFLFGPVRTSYAIGARTSNVTVDSEDAVSIIASCEACPVISLQMNYLDHTPKREWIITTPHTTLHADMIAKKLTVQDTTTTYDVQADDAYIAMHRAWIAHDSNMCTLEEGLALTRLIDNLSQGIRS